MDEIREKLKALLAEAQALWARLTSRERVLVGTAGGALLAFILFLTFFSFASTAAATRRRTASKVVKLQEVQALAATYNEAEQARQAAEQQLTASNVSLLSYIEEKGKGAGLDIPTMNPKGDVPVGDEGKIIESSVELTLTDISLPKLVQFLFSVEQGPGVVKVKYLRIEPRPANQVLTAWATVSTYHLKGTP